MARMIYGYRKDIEVDDRFPQWALNSEYAEEIYYEWEKNISFREECEKAQRTPEWRKQIVKKFKKMENL